MQFLEKLHFSFSKMHQGYFLFYSEQGLLIVRNFTGNSYYHRQLPLGEQVPSSLQSQFECEPIHFDFTNTSCFAGGKQRSI